MSREEMKWLTDTIDKFAELTYEGGGISRPAFSKLEAGARNYVADLMRQAGLQVSGDEIGNIIGRLAGREAEAPVVIIGAHLDTVPAGSKYDGVAGIVSGLSAINRLRARPQLTHPIELVVFAGEEASRFGFATIGSKVMTGRINIPGWKKAKDPAGIGLPAALADIGLNFKDIPKAVRNKKDIKAFLELDIEPGSMLAAGNFMAGIVDNIAAPTRFKITVEGVASQIGATPMEERRDALVTAAQIILAIQEVVLEHSYRGTVGTVGNVMVYPGGFNVIPDRVEMGVDIRGPEYESIVQCIQDIKDAIIGIVDEQQTVANIEMLSSEKPVYMDRKIINLLADVCERKNINYGYLSSSSSHDAMNFARLVPAGLIFLPGGKSDNESRTVNMDHIRAGIEVLTEALYELAK